MILSISAKYRKWYLWPMKRNIEAYGGNNINGEKCVGVIMSNDVMSMKAKAKPASAIQ